MKNEVKVAIISIFVFFLAVSLSYASKSKAEETVLSKVQRKYINISKIKLKPERKSGTLYSIDYKKALDEYPLMQKERIENSTIVRRENFELPFRSDINRQKVHQPLVYKSFVVSSIEKISIPYKSSALDLEFTSVLDGVKQGGVVQIGVAFLTSFLLHEFGHMVVADYVDATGTRFDFFKKQNGNFFLGTYTVKEISEESRLPLSMGG